MRIYFSGIGGVGIGPLAEIALDAGYDVCGSDPIASLMASQLTKRGVNISTDQSGEFLRNQHAEAPIDWYVYSTAVAADNPERLAAESLGIRTAKRDELLAHIIDEKNLKLIAVAGTHGKTTTTGMTVWTLQKLGLPVSYSVGTTLSWGPSGKFDPSSEYFVYECDEFDRNFLHFSPQLSIITSVEYDHPDTYPTEDDYRSAFRQFIHQSDASILWQRDADYIQTREPSAWCLQDDERVDLKLDGEHNRRNGTLVLKALERLDIGSTTDTRDALASFPGTNRRFEKLADNLYTDYGHTPTEIAATLQMARELADHIMLVYQPHQNIRQHEIRGQYADSVFENADDIYWLPTYLSREDPDLAILSPEQLTEQLDSRKLHLAEMDDALWQAVQTARDDGKLVLCMGAGSIDGWVRSKSVDAGTD